MITDVWAQLETVFAIHLANIYPGIQISGLNRKLQEEILSHLLKSVHDVEPMLEDLSTGYELYPRTIDSIIGCLLSDYVDGMVWVEVEIERLVLPQLGLFLPDEHHMSIHYIMGIWSPVKLIGFLELLRWIHDLDSNIKIRMEENTAPKTLLDQFNETWESYLNDAV